jgi:hypothetical protein
VAPAASCGRPTARCRPSSGSSPCRPASRPPSCREARVAPNTSTAKRHTRARRPHPRPGRITGNDRRPAHHPRPGRRGGRSTTGHTPAATTTTTTTAASRRATRNRIYTQLTSPSGNPSGAESFKPRRGRPGRQRRRHLPEQGPGGCLSIGLNIRRPAGRVIADVDVRGVHHHRPWPTRVSPPSNSLAPRAARADAGKFEMPAAHTFVR